jgi:hypothetical protein
VVVGILVSRRCDVGRKHKPPLVAVSLALLLGCSNPDRRAFLAYGSAVGAIYDFNEYTSSFSDENQDGIWTYQVIMRRIDCDAPPKDMGPVFKLEVGVLELESVTPGVWTRARHRESGIYTMTLSANYEGCTYTGTQLNGGIRFDELTFDDSTAEATLSVQFEQDVHLSVANDCGLDTSAMWLHIFGLGLQDNGTETDCAADF